MDLHTLNETPSWEWPDDAGEILVRVLRDRKASAEDRLLAADLAGDGMVIGEEVARTLIEVAGNGAEREDIRCTAATSLGPALENTDLMGPDEADEDVLTEETFRLVRKGLVRFLFRCRNPDGATGH